MGIEVYIDGACAPFNPGGTASYGVYMKLADGTTEELWGVIGAGPTMSNNVAEYAALRHAFTWLMEKKHTDTAIMVYSDSQLVINQMSKRWSMDKAKGLYVEEMQRSLHLSKAFPSVKYQWIPRDRNTFADDLTKRALAEVGITPWNIKSQMEAK